MATDRNTLSWLKRSGCIALACFCIFLVSTNYAAAQVDEGSITGTVQDATGAVVPDAQVTLLNTDQGITLNVKTNTAGQYTFSPVRIGHYAVTVSAAGFATTTQKNLTVNVAQSLQVNVQLKLGTAAETVEVNTAPPLLQTDESSVGQVITEKSVNDLPLNGRNFTFLAQLGAGAQSPQADTRGNAASGAFSANGLRPAQNNYLLDGIDNNSNAVDFLNGTNFAVLPPVDAISEFKVQTAAFSAELGRSAGAVLNATIKSGTNSLHGAAWEFFRNDKLDAADYFERTSAGTQKGALRQNQFGVSAGGPIIKNKVFFFGDYEGFRRVQGTVAKGSVPTANEISSGFTNLSDLVTYQNGTQKDSLGRIIPLGTVLDPATTRLVTLNTPDPVSGITPDASNGGSTGYVRDPFGTCPASTPTFTLAACGLNRLPSSRLDPVALKLLTLYPAANAGSGISSNYVRSPNLYEHKNSMDARIDYNPSSSDQVFGRFSYVDDPQFIPSIFQGIADGGGFQQGIQTAKSSQSVVGYTHVFTPKTINVAHVGFNHLHTTRFGPEGGTNGIPEQYGIQGIPQFSENGGLPAISIGGLATLGSNSFLPSDEVSQTLQITDDFTKIWGNHSFKMGIESQHVKFSVLQPAYSRGTFDFNGQYTDVPQQNNGGTGLAQLLLIPTAATVPNGVDYSGGSDSINASNVNKTYDARTYLATYFQDDWKVSPKLTLNLGLRWDYFSPIKETNGGQANFVPDGPTGNGVPTFLIPASGKDDRSLSTSFTTLLAKDGIALDQTDEYGQGLVKTPKNNFAPRAGFAYQITPRLVARGGAGLFYNAFENQGYGPNIGENYPFVFNFGYSPIVPANSPTGLSAVAPISYNTPWAGCSTAGPGSVATLSSGLSCVQFTPLAVNAKGLGLQGLQFNAQTPRTISVNATLQYSITHSMSLTTAYVFTQAKYLQQGIGANNVTALLPAGEATNNTASPGAGGTVPFPDFSGGSYQANIGQSDYNGLLMTLEQQYSNGLSFLLTYTYSKTLSDAGDLLNGGSASGLRAASVPGLGPMFDWGLADFDIRHVVHFSGGYELPIGKNKRFLGNSGRAANALVGGWSANWIASLQGGQPLGFSCPTSTTAGTSCHDVRVAGQSPKLGIYKDSQGAVNWIGNAKAFQQPCELGPGGTILNKPAGCIPYTGSAVLGDAGSVTTGPGFHRLDFSLFKAIPINDRFSMQFRTEFFNIFNHPNFNAPNFGGNGVVAINNSGNFNSSNFGEIGSTRDAPYDPRQIQFALKLYY
ncbi:TonB-dependent receptor [Edaphobacter dinghuensis]|nr:TonB-dependent receptor [Edaphobacter dinghuensis]